MRRILIFLFAAALCLTAGSASADKRKKSKKKPAASAEESVAPDKVLYERALGDIKHGRQEVGRLTLQTLINTYPDSEYLAKAKLSIADSYYKEGGTANLAQAIASYKDFGIFFPFLPEAAYAQMQVGMAHYRQLQKPDRDRSEARAAEDEFQIFLQKYPNDPLAPQAEQRLREVQEMLAEGDYRIARYYYVRGSYRASAGRLLTLTKRYPLYSKADRALWMLGTIFEKSEKKEVAAAYYAQIVRDYPLSSAASEAKKKLTEYGKPIPQPSPEALAWMQKERSADRGHANLLRKATGILHSGPDVRVAARYGKPNLEPESETAGMEALTPGGQTTLAVGGANGAVTAPVVEVVTPGVNASGAAQGPPAGGSNNPSSEVAPPTNPTAEASSGPAEPPKAEGPGNPPAAGSETPAAGAQPAVPGTPGSKDGPAKQGGAGADKNANCTNTQGGGSAPSADGKTTDNPQNCAADKSKESSSKKKKKKIFPW